MPGAISRTTGSAIRWNSLTPLFTRQGRDQPLSVTTPLKWRPVFGTSGGCVVALSMTGASGSEAAPTRLTRPAPTRAAAPVKKLRREFIDVILFNVLGARRRPP